MHPYYKQFSREDLLSWQGIEIDAAEQEYVRDDISEYDKSDQWEINHDISMDSLGMTWRDFF